MRQPDWDQERDNEQTRSSLLAALGVTAMHLADYAPPLQPIASEDTLVIPVAGLQPYSSDGTCPERRHPFDRKPLMTTCGFTQFQALDHSTIKPN